MVCIPYHYEYLYYPLATSTTLYVSYDATRVLYIYMYVLRVHDIYENRIVRVLDTMNYVTAVVLPEKTAWTCEQFIEKLEKMSIAAATVSIYLVRGYICRYVQLHTSTNCSCSTYTVCVYVMYSYTCVSTIYIIYVCRYIRYVY